MRSQEWSRGRKVVLLAIGALLTASFANAQRLSAGDETYAATDAVKVDRNAEDLRVRVQPQPVDRDRVDTVVVFTNSRSRRAKVVCVGRDEWGRPVGRIWLALPPRGLRFALASDVSNGVDFIGSLTCKSTAHVLGSAVLLAGELTDLRVVQNQGDGSLVIRFPLVATY